MSTTAITITIIIFTLIVLSIVAIYISQSRERARVEKIRRINTCDSRYQRMQQLLHDLPPQYLNNELRIMIAERSIETLHERIKLKSEPQYENYLKSDLDYLKNLKEKDTKFAPIKVSSEAKAKEVRNNLEVLSRFIQSQHKKKRLPAASAKKYLDYITLSICKSKADLYDARAQAAIKDKPRVAIHNYHCAIDAFKALGKNPQVIKIIQQYKTKIKQLENEANQKANTTQTKAAPVDNSEWDSFLKEEDPWKKKNTYDD